MDKKQGLSIKRAPSFDGSNYTLWRIRMEVYLHSLRPDVWKSVENGYVVPKNAPVDATVKRTYECNVLVNAVEERKYGYKKKLQTYLGQFETLNMRE